MSYDKFTMLAREIGALVVIAVGALAVYAHLM